MKRARGQSRASRGWGAVKALMTRAVGPFPLTPLGIILLLGCGWAFFGYGLKQLDLVLLVIGGAGLGAGVVGLLATLTATLVIWLGERKRRREQGAQPGGGAPALDVECGFPVSTGFSLPRLRGLPFVGISWRWLEPEAQVRVVARGSRLVEQVIASRRGQVSAVVRELEIGDIFGISQVRLRIREQRKVRFVPSVGNLKRVDVIRGMAGGDDISHPDGPADGELYDLRHYNPGDPIRFVLWKVFARTRQLVVRSPERALSPIRQTCAYLVAGGGDEPAAGAARLAVEHGALGNEWVLGADGSFDDATRKEQAVDVLARSAGVDAEKGGRGLGEFLARRSLGSAGRAVVFVSGRPGPWVQSVVEQCRGNAGRRGRIDFVVGTDGIEAAPKRGWFERLIRRDAPREVAPGQTQPVTTAEVGEVVQALSAVGRVLVVDRAAGRVFAGGQLAALDKSRRRG